MSIKFPADLNSQRALDNFIKRFIFGPTEIFKTERLIKLMYYELVLDSKKYEVCQIIIMYGI